MQSMPSAIGDVDDVAADLIARVGPTLAVRGYDLCTCPDAELRFLSGRDAIREEAMTDSDDQGYFASRARKERERSLAAQNKEAAAAHTFMADHYEKMARQTAG